MEKSIRNDLNSICDTINKTVNAREIYLFGSFAYGTPHSESDFDIYVVLADDSIRPIIAMQQIGAAIFGYTTRGVDVLANTHSRFISRAAAPTLERTIYNKGVKLYERV